ncbi:MAG TPA: apolipoprotein N-acyltransferase [Candidatus Kryptonia bacterium]|nr:apolipoprotein N-acyltransferase [Candidatus Kryptonia bacterium]
MSSQSNHPSRAEAIAVPAAVIPATRVRAVLMRLAPALSGGLIGATFLDFNLHLLAWVAFAPLLWALHHARDRREAVVLAAIAGVITNILGFYWLVYTINVFGGFPYPVAAFFFACLTAYSSLQFVLLALAFRRTGWGPLGIAPALVWTALEFLYPNLFPWRMAHSQYHVVPLIQIGEITGPYGLSFVVVWASAAVAMSVSESGRRRLAPVAAVAVAALALYTYGLQRIPAVEAAVGASPLVNIALVQGNIGIKEKGDERYFEVNVDRYRELTGRAQDRVALAVWPETVVQEWVPASATALSGDDAPFPGLRTSLIYGGLAFQRTGVHEADEFNSAFLIDGSGSVLGRYDKQILMPFGEYLPFVSLIPGIKKISPRTGGFTAGRDSRTFAVPGVGQVGPLICFEDISASIPRAMTNAGAEMLIAMANDAWYGASAAPYEHQALALWRAIENRRYLLRVNNSGVTGVIDPLGRVVAELPIFTSDALVVAVHPLRLASVYTRIGDVFGWSAVLVCVALLIRGRGQQGRAKLRA